MRPSTKNKDSIFCRPYRPLTIVFPMDEIPYLEWTGKDITLSLKLQIFNIIFLVNFAGNFYTFDTQLKNSTTWIFTNMCIALATACFLPMN